MAVTLIEAQDLVALLHRGTLASAPWEDFLRALERRLGADSLDLLLAGSGEGRLTQAAPGRPASMAAEDHLAAIAGPDSPLRAQRVYARAECRDLLDAEQAAALEAFMAERGLAHIRVLRVVQPGQAALTLVAGREREDFSGAESALLTALADHLEIALRTWSALERERLRAGISGEAVRRLNFGWFLLDHRGTILDHSDEAEALLQAGGPVLRSPTGRLLPQMRPAQGALLRFLDQARRGETFSRAVHLSDEPWLDMLLTTRPAGGGTAGPLVAAYIHGEQPTSDERSAQLQELFGLNAKEAQLALLISRGIKIAEAAGQLGLTVESARLYSKRVYAKTGTRGQADLVRLVLASVVALG